MAIKWKNKVLLVAWLLLFTFGLNGILSALSQGSDYLKKDYFQTEQFESQLNEFTSLLNMFELNYLPPEEMKKEITVTPEEIDEHRHRYGDLPVQINDIKQQYEQQIQEVQQSQNKELLEHYIAERDKKIEDITNNFKSDTYVEAKVVREKEQKIDNYYRDLEKYRVQFANFKTGFVYYLKDTTTGNIYTNLTVSSEAEANRLINSKNMLFIRSYPTARYGYLSIERNYYYLEESDIIDSILGSKKEKVFEGKIAVPKAAPATSMVLANYRDYQEKQKLFIIYTLIALVAFVLSLYLYKQTELVNLSALDKWQTPYNRIPIDICITAFGLSCLITLSLITYNENLHLHEYLYVFIRESITDLIFAAIFVAVTFLQGRLLFARIKDWPSLQAELPKSLLARVLGGISQAFAIRSIGTQVLLILSVTFAFGLGAAVVVVEPEFILIYAPAFLVMGVPILMMVVKRTGYFNRIVNNTTELAQGNLEPDLPVLGKSALATLAGNINTLKHGVKISRKEQAKSERLKTELITNVSHDLRTPLTSIITYTELLKTPDLSEEDRDAYVQIIDRKSKRLKILIDDLFEASKMASGSIELVKERVDLVQLLEQTLAEHNEAITESNLQFRVSNPDKPIYAFVDGQKLWRVFDNLIGNILKYSLENTRVYISLKSLPAQAIIIFKNVTKYELGEDIEELFERFKRGDTSRHTDGSGLGLAIAKSIVDLHDGNLDIEVDGDLFKITVTLPTKM
ncbi:sensor histidine kinase [Desulfotomaculum defluvii]